MEKFITNAWQKQSAWLYLLLPLSCLYGVLTNLRRWCYKKGIFTSYRAAAPIMVVGNITVGGTGKTPLVIALVKHLQAQGLKVGVISRGYGAQVADASHPRLVTASSKPTEVGDEPCEIVAATGVPLCVASDRKAATLLLLGTHPSTQLIISDDGLQHYAMQRDVEWVVVDSARGFGNGFLLPAGFLREPKARLKNVSVIHHGDANKALNMQLLAQPLQPLFSNLPHDDKLATPSAGQKVHAIAGIGNPERFYASLTMLGLTPIPHFVGDHHAHSLDELNFDDELPIVTTAKDAVKLRTLTTSNRINQHPVWVLPVEAKLSQACYDLLDKQLNQLKIEQK